MTDQNFDKVNLYGRKIYSYRKKFVVRSHSIRDLADQVEKSQLLYSLTFSIRTVPNVAISHHDHSMHTLDLQIVSGANVAQI